MGVPRGTTPTFTLDFEESDIDLTEAESVYVTFVGSSGQKVTKTGDDLDVQEKKISVYLTQSDSLKLPAGDVEIQANWTYADGRRCASDCVTYRFTKQLLEKVV